MKIDNIDVAATLDQARKMLKETKKIPPEFVVVFSLVLTVLELLLNRLNKNSKNSSIPPSQDPNRARAKKAEANRKPGGQPGHVGVTLTRFEDPDEIIDVPVDPATLPQGRRFVKKGHIARQVVELTLKRHVKEYRFEILADETGKKYQAAVPEGLSRPIQYGTSVKAAAVYMSVYQLIPVARVQDYFVHQAQIPVCEGSLCTFNKQAYERLKTFETRAKEKLKNAHRLNTDETSLNVGGKKIWLHNASNDKWTLFVPDEVRGAAAMDRIGILPAFRGVMVHDHWPAYFTYKDSQHALCNAHHLRELKAAEEVAPTHTWARAMAALLCDINEATQAAGGALGSDAQAAYIKKYREVIETGEKECPLPPEPEPKPGAKKRRGRIKKTKERNLLERLRDYETETLRFMTDRDVPFTNNQGENDIRMTKVQQKISGCFKSIEGAPIFCRVRSYLLTCQKHGLNASDALNTLFAGQLPPFMTS